LAAAAAGTNPHELAAKSLGGGEKLLAA